MKTELSLLQPEPGRVIRIYSRHRNIDFLHGYCRSICCSPGHMHFFGGFRCHTDPAMKTKWAQPCDFGVQSPERFSLEVTPEAEWMSLPAPAIP